MGFQGREQLEAIPQKHHCNRPGEQVTQSSQVIAKQTNLEENLQKEYNQPQNQPSKQTNMNKVSGPQHQDKTRDEGRKNNTSKME